MFQVHHVLRILIIYWRIDTFICYRHYLRPPVYVLCAWPSHAWWSEFFVFPYRGNRHIWTGVPFHIPIDDGYTTNFFSCKLFRIFYMQTCNAHQLLVLRREYLKKIFYDIITDVEVNAQNAWRKSRISNVCSCTYVVKNY